MIFLILFVGAGAVHAHLGHDNHAELRVFPDRMRLVFRTSLPFAWTLLGEKAPLVADEGGRSVAGPLLTEVAPSLFTISQDGVAMDPVKAEGLFEPDDHVAFVLNFPRPVKWPVTVVAKRLPAAGQLDATTLAVFDQTASPFARDIEPLLKRELSRERPGVSFDLTRSSAVAETPVTDIVKRDADPVSAPGGGRSLLWLAGSGAVTWLILVTWKRLKRKG